jgi:DNA (cytosine-5)-methyltransferase 1
MAAYYNEFDPYAAQWLRNLIAAGHIAPGEVDERSIVEVQADDVRDFTQAHFFAGLGGWSYAARLAGLADDEPLWTGSCPCQPFSATGKQRGTADERHLWPEWFRLIRAVRPVRVFGEQVEAAVRLGWLDAVCTDLEGEGYAFGAVVLGAHSVGAPHIRQRLWFVADADGRDARTEGLQRSREYGQQPKDGGDPRLMADADSGKRHGLANGERRECDGAQAGWQQGHGQFERSGDPRLMADADDAGLEGRRVGGCGRADEQPAGPGGVAGGVGDARSERRRQVGADTGWSREGSRAQGLAERPLHERDGGAGFWSGADWLPCRDGKSRPVEPGTFPLAHGVSGRVGRLRAYGNAIVPQVAAAFMTAAMECRP